MKWIFRAPVVALLALLSFTTFATTDTVNVAWFSSLPQFESPALSPSGNRIAYVRNLSGENELAILTTVDVKTGKSFYLLRSDNEKVKINWFHWANDDTLVISARYESYRNRTRFFETRLFSMPFDGQGETPTNLIDYRYIKRFSDGNHTPQIQDDVIDWLPDDPEHIMLAVDIDRPLLASVVKVHVESGRMSRLIKGKREVRDWMTDQQGRPRIAMALDYESGLREIFLVADEDDNDWETLFSYNAMTEPSITPKGFAKDPNLLYYTAYKGEYKALYRLNLTTKESELIYEDEGYDVNGSLIYSKVTNDAIGIRHSGADGGRYYWDDRFAPLQASLDKIFPDMHNVLVSFSDDEQTYIFYNESDTKPGTYYLGQRKDGALTYLAEEFPGMPENIIGEHKRITFTARDKTEIEGYLTLPTTGEAPYPTIIHPHGGPGARDFSGYDYWTAYFSSRGYAVLRPNFRGSSGYGYSFSQAQMKRWGLEMQDDITDATQWMVEQGYADPNRMCIVGASYGGYAALMATVKTPELFNCAVSFAGVTELNLIVLRSRRFTNNEFVKNQIGDDTDDLDARSPIEHVKKITTPILLVHGDEDRSVEVRHSRRMAEELADENKVFKYVELEAGDHYLSIQRNRHRFFNEMDAFLNQYLKPAQTTEAP